MKYKYKLSITEYEINIFEQTAGEKRLLRGWSSMGRYTPSIRHDHQLRGVAGGGRGPWSPNRRLS